MAELDHDVEMMKKGAALQGVDVADPLIIEEIRTQALNNLITNVLLLTAAQNAGMKTNAEAIENSYNELATSVGGEETLLERMSSVGLTKETLLENISDRLVVDQYLEAETDIETLAVTDEEVGAYVAQMTDAGMTVPPLEEVGEQIKASLLAEKQQAAVSAHIEELHASADIEIKVDGAVTVPKADEGEPTEGEEATIDGK
jgi:FKBP-type peptidyl-prolyl cis-trans isomerase (trigger factor)